MFNLLSIIAIGFILGMRHATDPDHVIAVTTIVTNQRQVSRSALIGAMWGLGHTLTILIVGAAIILFNLVIPVRLGLAMELSVSVMLILLGVWNLASFTRALPDQPVVHSHAHAHGNSIHSHPHIHHADSHLELAGLDRTLGGVAGYQLLRPLLVGVVHGLAGSAAVALLILATIRNPQWAIVYLLVFGVGTIAGMMLITMSIASALHYVGNRFARLSSGLRVASGVVSVAFGAFLAYEICVVQGFFGAHPMWTPH
jgi:ABC-type nickel/cobalt efflux system permease component RcnA